MSVHGPILDLNSKKIAISPISPFRPRRWGGKIVSDKSKIFIKNLDNKEPLKLEEMSNHSIKSNILKNKLVKISNIIKNIKMIK
mgnify:CR=1 FL=1